MEVPDLDLVPNSNAATSSDLMRRVENRKQFANYLLEKINRGNNDVNCKIFSDKVHSYFDGFVNQ